MTGLPLLGWVLVFAASGSAPSPAASATDDLEPRRAIAAAGVRVDDARAPLAARELQRFAAMVGVYARAGLVAGVLKAIRVDAGDPRHRYGARPQAIASSKTLRFWTRTWPGSALPEGSVFEDARAHRFYFAHELGHLVHAASPRGREAFESLHRASDPGTYDGRGGPPGDFVTAYAAESVEEDFAECFSFLTYGQYRWLWGRELKRAFETRPHLWKKLLHVAAMVDAVRGERDGRWPVVFAADKDGDGEAPPSIAWVQLSGDDTGRVNGIVLPPELATDEIGGCLGCGGD